MAWSVILTEVNFISSDFVGSTAGVLHTYKVDVIYKETPSFETNCILGKTSKNNNKKNQTKQTEQTKTKEA